MSRIEELIKEKCPDGVEYRTIESVIKLMQPKIKVKSNDYLQCGKYPVIDQGKEFIGGYTNEETPFLKDEYVIFGDHTCVVKYVDFEFVQGADGVKVLKADKMVILPRYLYHCMTAIKMVVDYARHWSKMKVEEIPVPPIEVQQEIVRILDKFTEIEAELQVELDSRKKQYEYYRNQLFTFGVEIERKSVKIVCDYISNFAAAGSFADVSKNVPYLSEPDYAQLIRTVDIKCNYTSKSPIYISEHSFNYLWRVNLDEPSIILPSVGNCGEVYYIEPSDLPYERNALAKNALLVRSSIVNMKFLKLYFETTEFQKQLKKITSSLGQTKFNKSDFEKLTIPVPTSDEQERIVAIMESFDKICNDATQGLPAEIEAHRKQYEYYRDKLLTFTRKAV